MNTPEIKKKPKRVPLGFNPRNSTDQVELSQAGSYATTERAGKYWRTLHWKGYQDLQGPCEMK